ncbi:MAG: tetratricopeptide repeat protein [Campylobacterota bacterium]|nr:tetratricopeptide repeat protein [Campylobacterota bacterium]
MKLIWTLFLSLLWVHATEVDAGIDACKQGDIKRCLEVGIILTTGENAENQEKNNLGLELIRKACKYGEEKACDILGDNYFRNHHYQAAKPYLETSCSRGIKTACEAMGTIYRDGHDIRQNDLLAREFYEKACALQSADACINVAIIYRGGFGVQHNRAEEKNYYKKACDAGSKAGCDAYTKMDNKDKGIEEPGFLEKLKSLFN